MLLTAVNTDDTHKEGERERDTKKNVHVRGELAMSGSNTRNKRVEPWPGMTRSRCRPTLSSLGAVDR